MKRKTAKNQHRTSGSSQRHLLRMPFLTLLVVLASSWTGCRHRSPDGLVFAGLKHKDLAGANVDRALVVDHIGTSGQDGIATNVEPALEWEVDLRLVGLGSGATITYTAVTDRPVSTMVWAAEGHDVAISASFERSPTYSLEISNGGTTVLTQSAIPNSVSRLRVIGNDIPLPDLQDFCERVPEFCEIRTVFRVLPTSGKCLWETIFETPARLGAGEGVVLGDRILLTEEHDSDNAHGAMVFTQMRIQAGRLSSLTIRDERVERPR